jgi:hypothetical protein
VAGLVACSGCTHLARHRAAAQNHLAEESRALTSAVVDALQMQPAGQRDASTATALLFAKQDQHIAGLPLAPFDVPALVAATNALSFAAAPFAGAAPTIPAQAELRRRFASQNKSAARERSATEQLVQLGVRAEEASNRRKLRWFKFGGFATTLIGGLIALIVFCPIALPLLGRALGWCVSRFPSLASKLGVVATGAFDSVVRGVENFKSSTFSNAGSPSVTADDLHASLSREMDAAHKELVRSRKTDLKLT